MLKDGVVLKRYQVVVYEKMKIKYTCQLILFLIIVAVHCGASDLEVKGGSETHLAPQIPSTSTKNNSLNAKSGGSDSNLASTRVDQVNKGSDKVGASNEDVKSTSLNKNNSSTQNEPKEAQSGQTSSNNNNTKETGEKKKKLDKGSEPKNLPKEVILPSSIRKENSRSEECDSSNQCKDDSGALIACLRVPGNDSPDLSLLVQNKGKGPLNVKISAPDFVWLEKTKIQLDEKEDVKVKVSIRNGGPDNLIFLTAGNGNCTLEFRNVVAQNSIKGSDYTSQSTYINLFKRTPFGFLFVALVLIMASIIICLSFKRRQLSSNSSPKYEKLDMELPVSGGPKMDTDLNDGWDNSWNDGWDDEEAPSMPVTPSLSSQGVSSRRVKKDGWKD